MHYTFLEVCSGWVDHPLGKVRGPGLAKTDGGAILGHLFKDRRLGLALAAAGTTNLVTGMLLYSKFYAGQRWNLASPGPTEAFGLGGALALAALIIGISEYGVWMARTLSGRPPAPKLLR